MASQRLSTWLALRCKESQFQQFLGVPNEDLAVTSVRAMCGVKTRGDIDRNPVAEKRFHQFIRLPYLHYLQYQQDPQNQSSQEK